MATKATYFLQNISSGNFMLWNVCSQAGSKAKIVLKDDTKVYFTIEKKTFDHNLIKLGQDSADYKGGSNLRLEIEVTDHPDLDIRQSINSYNITDQKSNIVGCGYAYCIEDHEDDDYNDYYIDIVAWNKKG